MRSQKAPRHLKTAADEHKLASLPQITLSLALNPRGDGSLILSDTHSFTSVPKSCSGNHVF